VAGGLLAIVTWACSRRHGSGEAAAGADGGSSTRHEHLVGVVNHAACLKCE
jgi:hypothetical protein